MYTVSGADSIQWAEFNPSGLDLTPISAFETRTFTDLQAAGFAYSGTRTSLPSRIHVDDFQVNAVVPEPTTLSLFAVSAVFVIMVRASLKRR